MKEIKAYVRPHMVDHVIDALEAASDRPGVTVTRVEGFGHPRQDEPAELSRRAKLEIVVPDAQVETVIALICRARAHGPSRGRQDFRLLGRRRRARAHG